MDVWLKPVDVWHDTVHCWKERGFWHMRVWPEAELVGPSERLKARIRELTAEPWKVGVVIERPFSKNERNLRARKLELEIIEFQKYPPGVMFKMIGWCWFNDQLWRVDGAGNLHDPHGEQPGEDDAVFASLNGLEF